MDPIVLVVIEHSLRAVMAFGPGILAAIFGTDDDEAALELARERARAAIAKIRSRPVDDAVRDAIAAHGLAAPTLPLRAITPHKRAILDRILASVPLSHEERDVLRSLVPRDDEPTREIPAGKP